VQRAISDEHRFGVLLEVAYDGTAFHGWATQKDRRTVEETIRGAVLAMDDRALGPHGTSRTDAGVHAMGQLAVVDATREIPPKGWVLGLNQNLPEDVAIRAARVVPAGFRPRFAAKGKRYRYRVLLDQVRDPAWTHRAWRLSPPVDLFKLAREAKAAEGTHDFAAFRASGDEREDTVRTLHRVAIEEAGPVLSIVIDGNAFLYNMVRILVGTMMDVARGRLAEGTIVRALHSKDRRDAGTTAPAHGLVLERVEVELPPGTGDPWPR
jgi:tRNA pseudouridine38-40 synthase